MKIPFKLVIIGVLTLVAIAAVYMLKPIVQDVSYHNFCDKRTFLKIPNFANVVSNFLFLLVGVRGLLLLEKSVVPGGIFVIYLLLFSGILLTGIG